MRPTCLWFLRRDWMVRLVAVLVLFHGALASGQEGPQDDAAKEKVGKQRIIAELIQRHERSVVGVARVRRCAPIRVITAFDRQRALDPLSDKKPRGPKDRAFIPNEFAAGVVVDSAGLILINYHVLAENSDYVVWVGAKSFDTTGTAKAYHARIKAADPRSDLAILEIIDAERPDSLKPIRFGDADTLDKGQLVVALGNPYAIVRGGGMRAAAGIVSGLGHKAAVVPGESHPRLSRPTLHHFGTLIQTEAKLGLGTSGGALLNRRGEMIGLATCVDPEDDQSAAAYAIPVDATFRRVVEKLKRAEEVEYGLLGVVPRDLSEAAKQRLGVRGALIQSVQGGSPARRAGVAEGDVVTGVNGRAIESEDDLMLYIGRLSVEASVQLDLRRSGRTIRAQAVLTKYPVVGKQVFKSRPAWRGMRVDYASVRKLGPFAYRYGPELYPGCVWVREVEKDSPAWESGVRPGMFVTHVEDQRVKSPKEFRAAVADLRQVAQLRIGGLRGGEDPLRSVKPAG